MSHYIEGKLNILAGADLAAWRRVKFNGTAYVYAGLNERHDAITIAPINNGARGVAVPSTFDGEISISAATALTAGNIAYAAANGQVTSVSTAGNIPVGRITKAAAGASDYARIIPSPGLSTIVPVLTASADTTVTTDQSGMVITNRGAAGTVVISLPAAPIAGVRFIVQVATAQALRIDPGDNDAFYWNGSKQADGKYLWADDEGEAIEITSNDQGDWITGPVNGTWTIEP